MFDDHGSVSEVYRLVDVMLVSDFIQPVTGMVTSKEG